MLRLTNGVVDIPVLPREHSDPKEEILQEEFLVSAIMEKTFIGDGRTEGEATRGKTPHRPPPILGEIPLTRAPGAMHLPAFRR